VSGGPIGRAALLALAGVLVVALLVVAVASPGGEPSAPGAPEGDAAASAPVAAEGTTYHAAPDGDDSGRGTLEEPWRTVDRALETLSPGDTLVLAPGTYGARGTVTELAGNGSESAPITVQGAPGEARPTLLGHYDVVGDHIVLSHLLFEGPTGEVKPLTEENPGGEQVQVAVHGDGVTIENSVIRDGDWHAGIFLSGADDATIESNCITGHGDENMLEEQYNKSHGIYWHSGSGVVAGNLVASNLARGVQLYEEPHDVTVADNAIVENGRAGIQFATRTSDSLAEDNIVAFNGDVGIRSHSLSGSGNLATSNVGYGNDNGDFATESDGLTLEDNVSLTPLVGPKGGAPMINGALPERYAARVAELRGLC
jgi:hypothetical protein